MSLIHNEKTERKNYIMTSIHTNNAIDSTEQDMNRSTTPRGPRAKYFMCINWSAKQYGPVEASSADEAKALWTKKHGTTPDIICGGDMLKELGGGSGYYLAKGTGMGDAQRLSVTVSAKDVKYTQTQLKAEFKGWVVYANCLHGFKGETEDFADDDLAILVFDQLIDKDVKVAKPKLKKHEAVRVSDLVLLDD
jgi:hypothetical protein